MLNSWLRRQDEVLRPYFPPTSVAAELRRISICGGYLEQRGMRFAGARFFVERNVNHRCRLSGDVTGACPNLNAAIG